MTRELDQLRATLDALRAGDLKKLAGLSDDDARRSTVDSGTNLAGLVQHLTFVESLWFEEIIAALGDPDAPVTRNGKQHELRWALLAVIQETARHAGHADILREQIDVLTGR